VVDFEERPEDPALGRLVESTLWVNEAHAAYRRAAALSRPRGERQDAREGRQRKPSAVGYLMRSSEGQDLVGGQVDGVELVAVLLAAQDGHEAPTRVVSPLHLGRLLATPDDGEDVARLDQRWLDQVAVCALRAVVEVVQVLAKALGVCSAAQPGRHAPIGCVHRVEPLHELVRD